MIFNGVKINEMPFSINKFMELIKQELSIKLESLLNRKHQTNEDSMICGQKVKIVSLSLLR